MEDLGIDFEIILDSRDSSDIEILYCSREDLISQPTYHRKRDYHDEHISNLRRNGQLRKPRIYKWDKDLLLNIFYLKIPDLISKKIIIKQKSLNISKKR